MISNDAVSAEGPLASWRAPRSDLRSLHMLPPRLYRSRRRLAFEIALTRHTATTLALTLCLVGVGCTQAANGTLVAAFDGRSNPPAMSRDFTRQARIDAAIADAARRTGTAAASIRLVAAEAVTWSDGALGCPQPGMFYTQALVPGHRIRVDAAGRVLEYHAGERGDPVYCPAERVREPLPGSGRS